MNDWRSTFGGVNDHEADWEQVTVFRPDPPDPAARPACTEHQAPPPEQRVRRVKHGEHRVDREAHDDRVADRAEPRPLP